MRGIWIFFLLFYYSIQGQVDHWEGVILEGDEWEYIVPNSAVPEDWKSLDFDASGWNSGPSGFGYGDGDDATIIPNAMSIYSRIVFSIEQAERIDELVFSVDYDDGFVAYLNGVEIARRNMSGFPPAYNQGSDGYHEATLYSGIAPEPFTIDPEILSNGPNILAIQVHNENINSSDFTCIPFLFAGISESNSNFRPTPGWFIEPLRFTESHLPLILIETNGQEILDDPKILAEIKMINNGEGQLNSITDPPNEYEGICGIEIRGESAQIFPKKSYLIEFRDAENNDLDTSFLGLPPEEDFILYAPYTDKTMLNNVLSMDLGNKMGRYASRTRFVELVINGDYKGVYIVMERIKRDNKRVDIARLRPDENSGDDLTGGYIVRIDKGVYGGWRSFYNAYRGDFKIFFQFFYPDQFDITIAQQGYIKSYFDRFEEAVGAQDFYNSEGKHYSEYINLRSFVDNFIINEFSKNVDAYRLSTYFHKDKDSKGGKIVAGPLWDFNLSFGNADYCGGNLTQGWEFYQCVCCSPFWWDRWLKDDFFANALKCRWEELRKDVLDTDRIHQFIDSIQLQLGPAIDRNYQRWPTLGSYVWPNPDYIIQAQTYDEHIELMKSWIENRTHWMDANIPGEAKNCEFYDELENQDGPDFDLEENEILRVFPNPSNSNFTLYADRIIEKIEIYNTIGQLLLEEEVFSNTHILNGSSIGQSGNYYLIVSFSDQKIHRNIILH